MMKVSMKKLHNFLNLQRQPDGFLSGGMSTGEVRIPGRLAPSPASKIPLPKSSLVRLEDAVVSPPQSRIPVKQIRSPAQEKEVVQQFREKENIEVASSVQQDNKIVERPRPPRSRILSTLPSAFQRRARYHQHCHRSVGRGT